MSANGEKVVRMLIAESSLSWDGAPLPAYPQGVPLVTMVRVAIPPHTKLAVHAHPIINAGVVLQGALTVVAEDGTARTFRAGEGIVEMVGKRHYGENRGEEPVELIMFYAGTEGVPLSE